MMLFKTVHGSHLYGLAHEHSDYDYYVVVDKVKTKKKKYAKQSIVNEVDTTTVDLGTFLHFCEIGVPQALEAMFSTQAEHDMLGALRAGYRAGTGVWDRYLRTIKSFCAADDYKRKRHALRLAYNLREMAETGRFSPTLDPLTIYMLDCGAQLDSEEVYANALTIVWG